MIEIFKNFKTFIVCMSLLFGLQTYLHSQVTIGDSVKPQPFSILEVSTKNTTGGIRLPHLTTKERDALSADATFIAEQKRGDDETSVDPGLALGLTIYNTTVNCIEYWDGYKWVSLCLGTADITINDYPATKVPAEGGERGPFTPVEKPTCTHNPPYELRLVVGESYASSYFLDEVTGTFSISFNPNTTARERLAIVRLTNNCSGEYKEFIFTQEGADICESAAPVPVIVSSTLNNGQAVICGDQLSTGSVSLAVTDATYDAQYNYIWMLNDIQEVGKGQYYVATAPGMYKVYVGGIGCEDKSASIQVVKNTTNNDMVAPSIMASNSGIVCGGTAVDIMIMNKSSITGTIKWYKNGIEVPALSGQTTISVTEVADYFAVTIDTSGCSSSASEIIKVTAKTGTPLVFHQSNVRINGVVLPAVPTFCTRGLLNMEIIGAAATSGYDFTWLLNGAVIGKGLTCSYNLVATVGEQYILSVVASTSQGGDCPTEIQIPATISPSFALSPVIIGNSVYCQDQQGVRLETTPGGASYLWKNEKNGEEILNTDFQTNLKTGEWIVTITTPEGCISTTPTAHKVELKGAPVVYISTPASSGIQEGVPAEFQVKANSDYAPITGGYKWKASSPNGVVVNLSNDTQDVVTLTATGSGTVVLQVYGIGQCGNSAVSEITFSVRGEKPVTPIITPPITTAICEGYTFTLSDESIAAYDALYDRWFCTWTIRGANLATAATGISNPIVSGANNRNVSVNFTTTTSTPVTATVNVFGDGLTSDNANPVTIKGSLSNSRTYQINGQDCYDIAFTDWEAGGDLGCGRWQDRTPVSWNIEKIYTLTGTDLTKAYDIEWSVRDMSNEEGGPLVDAIDQTNPKEIKVLFNNLYDDKRIKGNDKGLTITLVCTFKYTDSGCTAYYSVELPITIKDCQCCSYATDIDGNTYQTHRFGDAGCWMTETLAVTKKPDGTPIPMSTKGYSISKYITYARSLPVANGGESWGLQYDWQTITDNTASDNVLFGVTPTITSTVQGICPAGWVVPSDKDWNDLEKAIYEHGSNYSSLPSGVWQNLWDSAWTWRPNGSNNSYWGAMMKSRRYTISGKVSGGYSYPSPKGFDLLLTERPYWATSSTMDSTKAWCRYFEQGSMDGVNRHSTDKNGMFSVRCKLLE